MRRYWAKLQLASLCILVSCSAIAGEVMVHEIRVIDDQNKSIASKIVEINIKDEEQTVDYTNDDGVFDKGFKCPDRHMLIAKPRAGLFTNSRPARCETKMVLKVTSVKYASALYFLGTQAEKEGNVGKAALFFNDLAYRFEYSSPKFARDSKKKTLESVGIKLGVNIPFVYDAEQKDIVATPDLVKAVGEYQKTKGLSITKQVDYSTLKAMAGEDIGAAYSHCKQFGDKCYSGAGETWKEFEAARK